LIDFLPLSNRTGVPNVRRYDPIDRKELSLDTLIPDNPNMPYDMMELIRKIVDEGDFFEIQPSFAKNIITGFGRIDGQAQWGWSAISP
jgi:propionyl-CoA carboxylase beta chain